MNKVVSDALIIAYEYAAALNFSQDMEPVEKTLKSIAGESKKREGRWVVICYPQVGH